MARDQGCFAGLWLDKLDKRILTLVDPRQEAGRAREEGFMTSNPGLEIKA